MSDNRIFNGSFEKGLKGWTLFDDVSGGKVGPIHTDAKGLISGVYADGDAGIQDWDDGFGFNYATATDGSHSFWTPFDGAGPGVVTMTQQVSLGSSAHAVLHFDFQAAWNLVDYISDPAQNRDFAIEVRDLNTGKVFDFDVLTAKAHTVNDGARLHQEAIDLSRFAGHDIILQFKWLVPQDFTGPASFTLDNIELNANEQFGGKTGDVLKGSFYDDTLIGNGGADTLHGKLGADELTGGHGRDTFLFTSLHESSLPLDSEPRRITGVDLITDLDAHDVIDISGIDADHHQEGDQAFRLVSAFDGGRGEAKLSFDAENNRTILALDVNGDQVADMIVHISGQHTDFTNFVL